MVTDLAIEVFARKLMRPKMFLVAERLLTVIALERLASRLVLLQGFLMDEVFLALTAITVARGFLVVEQSSKHKKIATA